MRWTSLQEDGTRTGSILLHTGVNITFQIHEIVSMGGDLAYVRTTSSGTQELLANHKVLKEDNNELLIFRREDGKWKIHRYLFAEANPPGSE